ncbi:HAD-IA family hydrolase [Salinicola salarius]|uniref:HAD-IA family hydrolase n=1 Tax=Salinicola salarius TaxID=430457 RepID=UPI001FC93F4F|nr:HAD-IA family hydrolase [Salinicola salarius]MEC8917713.1 HAD-IA family hydrolase [Pseudomonadota bacterium]MED5500689.1 HAD-IA family hydrolase [Pseudomonadota bacterium]
MAVETSAVEMLPGQASRRCRYSLVIFDWDGTLMDSAARIVACMQAAARELQWPVPDDAAVRDIIGLGLPEAVAVLFPGVTLSEQDRLREVYGHQFRAVDRIPTPFFPGVAEGIRRLRDDAACRLAVATGKSRRGLDRVFGHESCGNWFVASRTADLTRSKPHPLMLEELVAECGVPVAEAVMVGDTEYDLEMARAIGMDRVAVTYGVHERQRLMRSEPQFVADDFSSVVEWLLA